MNDYYFFEKFTPDAPQRAFAVICEFLSETELAKKWFAGKLNKVGYFRFIRAINQKINEINAHNKNKHDKNNIDNNDEYSPLNEISFFTNITPSNPLIGDLNEIKNNKKTGFKKEPYGHTSEQIGSEEYYIHGELKYQLIYDNYNSIFYGSVYCDDEVQEFYCLSKLSFNGCFFFNDFLFNEIKTYNPDTAEYYEKLSAEYIKSLGTLEIKNSIFFNRFEINKCNLKFFDLNNNFFHNKAKITNNIFPCNVIIVTHPNEKSQFLNFHSTKFGDEKKKTHSNMFFNIANHVGIFDHTQFNNVNLVHSEFKKSSFEGASFINCRLDWVNLSGNFSFVNFTNSEFKGTKILPNLEIRLLKSVIFLINLLIAFIIYRLILNFSEIDFAKNIVISVLNLITFTIILFIFIFKFNEDISTYFSKILKLKFKKFKNLDMFTEKSNFSNADFTGVNYHNISFENAIITNVSIDLELVKLQIKNAPPEIIDEMLLQNFGEVINFWDKKEKKHNKSKNIYIGYIICLIFGFGSVFCYLDFDLLPNKFDELNKLITKLEEFKNTLNPETLKNNPILEKLKNYEVNIFIELLPYLASSIILVSLFYWLMGHLMKNKTAQKHLAEDVAQKKIILKSLLMLEQRSFFNDEKIDNNNKITVKNPVYYEILSKVLAQSADGLVKEDGIQAPLEIFTKLK